jgi:ABC-type phosphate/phosphonate transport system substrate-binding protein
MLKRSCLGVASAGLLALLALCSPVQAAKPAGPVKIGMVGSLFRDVPPALAFAMMKPFGSVMESMTGVEGELCYGGDAMQLGDKIAANEIQLGIFHGFEYGWVRARHPQLQPLMIAVNHDAHLRACLVVNGTSDIKSFADLAGKTLAMPRGTREHCRIFLDDQCRLCGKDAAGHFEKVTKPFSAEDTLDDIVDDLCHATIVDNVALQCYTERKPGRAAKLKTVLISDIFPAGVVVYDPSTLDEGTVKKFRNGLLGAKDHTMGKQMLTFWKLTSFERVPEDYDSILTSIVKAYPPPGGAVIVAKPEVKVEATPVKNVKEVAELIAAPAEVEAVAPAETKPATGEESPAEPKGEGETDETPGEDKPAGDDSDAAPGAAKQGDLSNVI